MDDSIDGITNKNFKVTVINVFNDGEFQEFQLNIKLKF